VGVSCGEQSEGQYSIPGGIAGVGHVGLGRSFFCSVLSIFAAEPLRGRMMIAGVKEGPELKPACSCWIGGSA
jgi:hypothetical protein